MIIRTLALVCAIGLAFCGSANASIIAVIRGNDAQAIFWLANHHDPTVSGLDLIVKEDIGGAVSGPGAGGWDLDLTDAGRSGSWSLIAPSLTPEFWLVKFGNLIAIYSYDGPGSSPFSDSFNLNDDVWSDDTRTLKIALRDEDNNVLHNVGAFSRNGVYRTGMNAKAQVSHISVLGTFGAIPEPGTMTIWAIGCLVTMGVGLRRRS